MWISQRWLYFYAQLHLNNVCSTILDTKLVSDEGILLLLEKHSSLQIILAASHQGGQESGELSCGYKSGLSAVPHFAHHRFSLCLPLQRPSEQGGRAGPAGWRTSRLWCSVCFSSSWRPLLPRGALSQFWNRGQIRGTGNFASGQGSQA